MLLLGSIIAGLLLLVVTSAALSALGIGTVVLYAAVVVAVHTSLRRPFHDAAVTMLLVAWASDLLGSGPPGLHALAVSLVFFAIYALAQRVGGRYLLAAFALATGASMLLALAEALLVGLYTTDVTALRLFVSTGLPSSLLTGVVAVPYSAAMSGLERLWQRRTERSIIVD